MSLHKKTKLLMYFALPNEQFTTPQLLKYGVAAEEAGFDGVWTSDHFQPWQPNEGHAGSAWVLLAALTQCTSRIHLGTGVTCPAFRYNPAVIAQNWASLSLLAPRKSLHRHWLRRKSKRRGGRRWMGTLQRTRLPSN
jgi:alkanesulfonate monooxygenase SsuD/methylene tetrahydromethanopterin reductase-like flavin-dependent oxidoreductase (luciferase family)